MLHTTLVWPVLYKNHNVMIFDGRYDWAFPTRGEATNAVPSHETRPVIAVHV